MFIPASTYRVQLHKDFNFTDLELILDYLHDLGVTTIYAAPILKAKPESMHGYDVVDPHQINPEIGTLQQFKSIIETLRGKGMTWIQDIVPNHMAFHTSNTRLMDVLERGMNSPYANYFDIDWNHHNPKLNGKLQVPFLGKPLKQCISDRELTIDFSAQGFTINYFDTTYPLSFSAFETLSAYIPEIESSALAGNLKSSLLDWRLAKDKFIDAILSDEKKFQCVLDKLFELNQSSEIIEEILMDQSYVLTYWKDTEKQINYRRFFTVNELICLRMEEQSVFDDYHSFIHGLYKNGLIQGIRIDHIDGLQDPLTYLERLRALFGPDCYIIAEKILEAKEGLPQKWPIEGTSGYEFLSYVSQLVTNRKGARQLLSFYKGLIPNLPDYKELVVKNKWLILENYMAGEWGNLVQMLSATVDLKDQDQSRMKMALGWLMVSLPVYRIYPEDLPLKYENREVLHEAFQRALTSGKEYQPEIEWLRDQLLEGSDQGVLHFLKRLMQFTGPLTAKGVEDTTFYVYNALISHDEVGDAPSSLGISINEFHRKMGNRQSTTPLSLNTTATHDTKRGEDARIRLNVLCDYPDLWEATVTKWLEANRSFKTKTAKGVLAPTVNDEYYIYQSIVGGFPEDFQVSEEFVERVIAYQTKVLREAKVNSNWSDPDTAYEEGCHSFIRNILSHETTFLQTLVPLLQKITILSLRYSLAQTLIKITAPGIPDTYQGGALWDLSFVDPDNRRAVNFDKRYAFLQQLIEKSSRDENLLFAYLEDHRAEGIEKLFLTWKALNFRKSNADLFTKGNYTPLQTSGDEVVTVAYARNFKSKWVLIIIPLRIKDKTDQLDLATGDELILPENAPTLWRNVFTGEVMTAESRITLADRFNRFPVTMFESY
jgi:(1->4)-alpha-D-glucan 1-alpha-D-glucosylmutase